MGRALCLEAAGAERLEEAAKAYAAFIAKYPEHFLVTQAQMGQARILALQGKKAEAATMLETLKAGKNNDPMAEMAITQLQGVIARYEPRNASPLTELSTAPVTAPTTVTGQPTNK